MASTGGWLEPEVATTGREGTLDRRHIEGDQCIPDRRLCVRVEV